MGFIGDLIKVMFVNNPFYSGEFTLKEGLEMDQISAAITKVHSKSQKGGQLCNQHSADDNSQVVYEYRVNMPDGEIHWYSWKVRTMESGYKVFLTTKITDSRGNIAKGNAEVMFNSAKNFLLKNLGIK